MKQIGSLLIVIFAFAAMTASLYALDPVFHFQIDQWRQTWNHENELVIPKVVEQVKNAPVKAKTNHNLDVWAKLDAHAVKAPRNAAKNIPALADYLIKPCKTDMEKARVIFRWLAQNISYDDDAYNSNSLKIWTADEILSRRKGVCEDFSNLFVSLADAAGLEAVKVSGYSKGYGFSAGQKFEKSNHAWNAFKAEGTWHLVDATWGQGNGTTVNGKLKSKREFDPFWFDTNPNAFVFSHLPEDAKWQLISNPISLATYSKMPDASPALFDFGFNSAGMLEAARKGDLKSLAVAYNNDLRVRAIQASPAGTLLEETFIDFVFECTACSEMVFVNNGGWTYLEKVGNRFSGSIFPSFGELTVYGRKGKKDKFVGLLKYKIVASNQIGPDV